jgi:hypothetical protein
MMSISFLPFGASQRVATDSGKGSANGNNSPNGSCKRGLMERSPTQMKPFDDAGRYQ